MPKLLFMVPETDSSTSRPVILEIIKQVMSATGLEQDTNILFPSELEKEAQLGSRLNDSGEKNKFTANDRIYIDVDEDYVSDRILSTVIYRPESGFVFLDNSIGVYIKPAYSSTDISVNFRYKAKDKIAAKRWRDEIRTRTSMMRTVLLHTATYHYLIPPELLYVLKEIHRLRENVAGYNETYEVYLKKFATNRLTLLTNLAGTKDAWAISETQMRIQGWFDFDIAPDKPDKNDDTDAHTVSFSYKFRYDKPIACVMKYPFMIHNQLLSKKYVETKLMDEENQHEKSYSLSMWHLGAFEKNSIPKYGKNTPGLAIPDVDDFIPDYILPSTVRIFTALVKISSTDKKTLLDLKTLGKYKLTNELIAFLKSEGQYLTKPYESIFNISVYKNTSLLDSKKISINNELVISSINDLDLREYHHVSFRLVTDLSLVSRDGLDRLRESGIIFKDIIHSIDNTIPVTPSMDNYVTKKELEDIIDILNQKSKNNDIHFKTVETFYIEAHKGEN